MSNNDATEKSEKSENKQPAKSGPIGYAANYVMTGAGLLIGLTAEQSTEVKTGLEEIIKRFNYDELLPTLYKIADAVPNSINEQIAYGAVGFYSAKVLSDICGAIANTGDTQLTSEDRLGYKIMRWGAYYAGTAIGMAYGADKGVFKDTIEQTTDCMQPFIENATDPKTYAMWLGAAGVMTFYHLVQKPAFRFAARLVYYANKILNFEYGGKK